MQSRTVLITGASFGIGLSLAKSFLSDGCKVIAVSRSRGGLEDCILQSEDGNSSIEFIAADLSIKCERERVLESLKSELEINVLIHNVGGAIQRGNLLTLDEESWLETFQINVLPAVTLTKGLWTTLVASKDPRVLFIGSLVALEPGHYDPHYSAAKAALLNFSKHVAKLGASKGLLANSLLPGPILTKSLSEFIENSSESDSDKDSQSLLEKELVSRIPLGRLGVPEDLVGIARYLCSQENKWITGSNIKIDGGKSYGI
jgi:NAD(P)-dependent dehydrogenase (short-subunit alcohol dehydrogenase family)